MTQPLKKLSLVTFLDMAYFTLAMSFVEESAGAFGMASTDALKLRLGSEEIFTYLTGSDQTGKALKIEAEDGLYFVEVRFLLEEPFINNLTQRDGEAEGGMDLAHMGLVLASRSVDRLYLLHDAATGHGVGLVKEKSYPEAASTDKTPVRALDTYEIVHPDGEALKYFIRQVGAYYARDYFPVDFRFPGKVADMAASGLYHILVATDGGADVAGGIVWRTAGARRIEAFGPYLFGQPPEFGMAEALTEAFLMEIGKTDALCVTTMFATPEMPEGYFELLGSIDQVNPDGQRKTSPVYYRQLNEDPGLSLWAHPGLEPFLRQEYDRLFLARDIRLTADAGESRPTHSLFSVRVDRLRGFAVLRLIWDGADAATRLDEHLKSLREEGFGEVFFEADLAYPWETGLMSSLTEMGFEPRIILPHAGASDVVLFQYRE